MNCEKIGETDKFVKPELECKDSLFDAVNHVKAISKEPFWQAVRTLVGQAPGSTTQEWNSDNGEETRVISALYSTSGEPVVIW